ncbi:MULTISPECIES: glycosyltransferase family 2 protein [unclassified Solwaraspora]|uniref:glycosyltransferase family 2 protein n=1 Tax=unclassified Solwaraspora TaxID=2627926 RepID=UPI00259BA10C|nr:glycosyltransferase family 2 protein [Solwaraspora sp. WMMA2056]WJK42743.1 glycosyltransferase family 2 protein [Solwaraspora sp. WMMA2056]
MTTPNATAVVVTYNSEQHIRANLRALDNSHLPIVVVDNASRDSTVSIVRSEFPGVSLHANTVNVGFATAVNQAITDVRTDVVLLVNPDCVCPLSTVEALLDTLDDHPTTAIVGPRIRHPDGRVAISAHPFESLATVVASRFGGSLLPVGLRRLMSGNARRTAYDACRDYRHPVHVDWVSGACMAVRTDLLRRIGGLDEGYFLYYEDEELCLQAWRNDEAVMYLPGVEAVHVGGGSSNDPTRSWPHLYQSMLRFFALNQPSTLTAVRVAVLLRAALGIGLAGIRLPVQPRAGVARVWAWSSISRIALSRQPEKSWRNKCT